MSSNSCLSFAIAPFNSPIVAGWLCRETYPRALRKRLTIPYESFACNWVRLNKSMWSTIISRYLSGLCVYLFFDNEQDSTRCTLMHSFSVSTSLMISMYSIYYSFQWTICPLRSCCILRLWIVRTAFRREVNSKICLIYPMKNKKPELFDRLSAFQRCVVLWYRFLKSFDHANCSPHNHLNFLVGLGSSFFCVNGVLSVQV